MNIPQKTEQRENEATQEKTGPNGEKKGPGTNRNETTQGASTNGHSYADTFCPMIPVQVEGALNPVPGYRFHRNRTTRRETNPHFFFIFFFG
jgi:hypothetical protein